MKRGTKKRSWIHRSVLELIRSDGNSVDPEQIIRQRARALIEEVADIWEGPPYDMETLASLRGYRVEEVDYLGDDQDACITLGKMLVNAQKPSRRRRYSVGHEIGHTFFPDFAHTVELEGPRWRRERNSQSEVELLCQIAASELLMPVQSFTGAMEERDISVASLIFLADLFEASLEATTRRMVDLTDQPVVAVFLAMKHKPTEQAELQQMAFDLPGLRLPQEKLRVTYAATSAPCSNFFVPPDKSVPANSVAYHVWNEAGYGALGPCIACAEEDWTEIGGMGLCHVEAVSLPLSTGTRQAVLCLVQPEQ